MPFLAAGCIIDSSTWLLVMLVNFVFLELTHNDAWNSVRRLWCVQGWNVTALLTGECSYFARDTVIFWLLLRSSPSYNGWNQHFEDSLLSVAVWSVWNLNAAVRLRWGTSVCSGEENRSCHQPSTRRWNNSKEAMPCGDVKHTWVTRYCAVSRQLHDWQREQQGRDGNMLLYERGTKHLLSDDASTTYDATRQQWPTPAQAGLTKWFTVRKVKIINNYGTDVFWTAFGAPDAAGQTEWQLERKCCPLVTALLYFHSQCRYMLLSRPFIGYCGKSSVKWFCQFIDSSTSWRMKNIQC
jgi:hypothetical protein